jgi:hypothetical protein
LTKFIVAVICIAKIYEVIMSVPPDELMKLMKGQQSGMDQPSPEDSLASPTDGTPPMASPMSTPEPKLGSREGALVNLGLAMDLIEQALPAIGSESPEGQKAIAALRTLTGILGAKKASTNELKQSEILQMLQALPQAGGATPESRALSAAPQIPGMNPQAIPAAPTPPQMGEPGGAGGMPGGMPPGGMPGGMPGGAPGGMPPGMPPQPPM